MSILDFLRGGNGHAMTIRRKQLAAAIADIQSKREAAVTATSDFGWDKTGTIFTPNFFEDESDSSRDLVSLKRKSAIIWACVQELSTSISEAPLQIGKTDDKGNFDVVDDAPSAFYNNPDYSFNDIIQLTVQRLSLTGASFYLLSPFKEYNATGQLTPLPTQNIEIVSAGPSIKGYKFHRGQGDPVMLAPEDVCPAMYLDPARFHGYVSPMASALREYSIDRERQSITMEHMKNKKIPGGFIQFGDKATNKTLSDPQRKQLTESINTTVGGSTESRGKLLFLPGGLQFKDGVEISDIDFTIVSEMAESRICMAFGVPPIIIGSRLGLLHATYANYGEARESFYKETLIGLWSFLADAFTRSIKLFDESLEFRFDLSDVPELQEDLNTKSTRIIAEVAAKIITKAEARNQLGYPELTPEQEEELKPAPVPAAFAAPEKDDEPAEDDDDEEGKSHFAKVQTQWFDDVETAQQHFMRIAQDNAVDCNCGLHGKARSAIGSFPDSNELSKALISFFHRQEDSLLMTLPTASKSDQIDLSDWNDRLEDELRPILADIYESKARGQLRSLSKDVRKSLEGKSDTIPEAGTFTVEGSFTVVQPELVENLDRQVRELAQSVNLTTSKNLDAAIAEFTKAAVETNTIPNLKAAVRKVFTNATDARARMIAVTESSRAVHDAQIIAGAESGVVAGYKTILSPDACPICQYVDASGNATGVPVFAYQDIAAASEGVGLYKSDAPPFHPNCRCTQVAVLIGESPPKAVAPKPGWQNTARPGGGPQQRVLGAAAPKAPGK